MPWHDIWHLTFDIYCDLTRSAEISQDLLRSHKIYWDLKRSTDLALYIWHFTFYIWYLTFTMWYLTFDIWHLTFDIWYITLICHDMISYNDINTIHIHFMWWILSEVISVIWNVYSVDNIGLRNASASKNTLYIWRYVSVITFIFAATCQARVMLDVVSQSSKGIFLSFV